MGVETALVVGASLLMGLQQGHEMKKAANQQAAAMNELSKVAQLPTALAEGAGTAEEADTAADAAAKKKSDEEAKRRAALGRKSTFSGSQTGLLGPAPVGKKVLLGQ